MSGNELSSLLESISDKDKAAWEQTRWLGYIQALTQGAKIKKPTDLMMFEWEKKEVVKDTRTKEEVIESLLKLSNTFNEV